MFKKDFFVRTLIISGQHLHPTELINVLSDRYFRAILLKVIILLHGKFLQFDWLRAVVFQLNLKYLHVKITKLLWVVV